MARALALEIDFRFHLRGGRVRCQGPRALGVMIDSRGSAFVEVVSSGSLRPLGKGVSAMARYLISFDNHGGSKAYSGAGFGRAMHYLFQIADIRTSTGAFPHTRDLRHTHAVHALLRWYRAGVDVQAKLPALAIAMGHVSIASTAYYLAFLEPVAAAASARFARHCRQIFAASGDRR